MTAIPIKSRTAVDKSSGALTSMRVSPVAMPLYSLMGRLQRGELLVSSCFPAFKIMIYFSDQQWQTKIAKFTPLHNTAEIAYRVGGGL